MIDTNKLRAYMIERGVNPPEDFKLVEGVWQRWSTTGKRFDTDGWLTLLTRGDGVAFGSWKNPSDERHVYFEGNGESLSNEDFRLLKAKREDALRQLAIQREAEYERHEAIAQNTINGAKGDPSEHFYIQAKGIKAGNTKCVLGWLYVPKYYKGRPEPVSLQTIYQYQGETVKLNMKGGRTKGCYHLIGNIVDGDEVVVFVEGFATGMSIHMATGLPVIVTFSAQNMLEVALWARGYWPNLEMIFAADDDWKTDGNPGITWAKKAASAVGGKLAIPSFDQESRSDKDSDFNDMHRLTGLQSVLAVIDKARFFGKAHWENPEPVVGSIERLQYPVNALPGIIREAVDEVQKHVQSPYAMVASCALSVLATACQGHYLVRRFNGLDGRVSIFTIVVNESGERKTATLNWFSRILNEHAARVSKIMEPQVKAAKSMRTAWERECEGIKQAITNAAKSESKRSDIARLKEQLVELEASPPALERVPHWVVEDETQESLMKRLVQEWPSINMMTSEGATVLGGPSMSSDNIFKFLGFLNKFWDGERSEQNRTTREGVVADGVNLSVFIMVQDGPFERFMGSNEVARDSGFFARFLMCKPESTVGHRMLDLDKISEPDYGKLPGVEAFAEAVTSLLDRPLKMNGNGGVVHSVIDMTDEARATWADYYNKVEAQLRIGGELASIRDAAAKIADNVARIAALFQIIEDGDDVGLISNENMQSAILIGQYHLRESQAIFEKVGGDKREKDAIKVDEWVTKYCKSNGTDRVPARDIDRKLKITSDERDAAVEVLSSLKRARYAKVGKTKYVCVNPLMLVEA